MASTLEILPGEAVAEVLSAKSQSVAQEASLRVLRKALDSEQQAATDILKMMGLGARLDTTA